MRPVTSSPFATGKVGLARIAERIAGRREKVSGVDVFQSPACVDFDEQALLFAEEGRMLAKKIDRNSGSRKSRRDFGVWW